MTNMTSEQLSLEFRQRTRHEQFTLRFKRAIQFPRFAMDAGEDWTCSPLGRTGREYRAAVEAGVDRFPFAGGSCLIQDVEVVA